MELYINSAGIISSAGNNIQGSLEANSIGEQATHALSIEPDYKEYIPVMQLRRMSKAVRMGVVASKIAMQQAGMEKPDAISVGTAYGCMQDTERFLSKMIEQEEQMLTPTAFIQSTHNTVSGQIALLSKCNAHNLTYVHRGHSFEHAIIDAQLKLSEVVNASVLVGGIDELTDNSIKAIHQAGVDTILGEGAVFLSVTGKPRSDKYLKVKALEVFTADDINTVREETEQFIQRNKLESIDLAMLGVSTDGKYAPVYDVLKNEVLTQVTYAQFKHLCGEYPVASSFALGLLFESIEKGQLPDSCYLNKGERMKNIILVNNFCDHYSIWALGLSV